MMALVNRLNCNLSLFLEYFKDEPFFFSLVIDMGIFDFGFTCFGKVHFFDALLFPASLSCFDMQH